MCGVGEGKRERIFFLKRPIDLKERESAYKCIGGGEKERGRH